MQNADYDSITLRIIVEYEMFYNIQCKLDNSINII